MFIEYFTTNPGFAITWIGIVMFSICLHEYAHAATALKLGDDTAANEGHLTLNPMIQMGLMSIIFLFIIGIAWGSVPVDERRLRGKYGPAIVAVASSRSRASSAERPISRRFARACASGSPSGFRSMWLAHTGQSSSCRPRSMIFVITMSETGVSHSLQRTTRRCLIDSAIAWDSR